MRSRDIFSYVVAHSKSVTFLEMEVSLGFLLVTVSCLPLASEKKCTP